MLAHTIRGGAIRRAPLGHTLGARGMAAWVKFEQPGGETAIGTLEGDSITGYTGELLSDPTPSGKTFNLADVKLLAPYQPRQILALWNNFFERAKEEGQDIPEWPLIFMKPVSSVVGPGRIYSFVLDSMSV